MKMPKLPKFSLPRRKKLHAATAARRAPAADDYYEDEPKTNLSSAFIVVLILHLVAVGGIYAFNSIKAARRGHEPLAPTKATNSAGALTATKATPPAETSGQEAANPSAGLNAVAATPVSKSHVYQVKSGDTVTKIAQQHGVTAAELEEANGLKPGATLNVGRVLNLPKAGARATPSTGTAAAATTATPSPVADAKRAAFLNSRAEPTPAVNATAKTVTKSYVVAKGDTPTSIAKKFGMTADELLKLNNISDPKRMQLGQTLKVPVKKTN